MIPPSLFRRAALVAFGTVLALGMTELLLRMVDPHLPPEKRFTLPSEWKKQSLQGHDYMWQGHLHRFNNQDFRGDNWGPKRADTFRIVVFGDSMTYGFGVDEQQAYPERLQSELSKRYRVEVLNLGHSGAQSEDIAWLGQHFIPRLKPDLVLYGVCLNDYLPSGQGQYRRIGPFKLPDSGESRTRIGDIAATALHRVLMKIGVEKDFLQDALDASSRYAERFQRDVGVFNTTVLSHVKLPAVGMAINHIPDQPEALALVRQTEAILHQAGLIVVPAEPYLNGWAGRDPLVVSRWESHPNAEAHAAFASAFAKTIEETPQISARMDRYKIARSDRTKVQ